jgi:phage shock protein PspC (stress-responsive transcriptional regulator)
MIRAISGYFEKKAYGVCSAIADRMGIRAKNVRLSFVYLSFLTVGSPVGLYLILLFWRRNRHIFKPWQWGQRNMDH